VLSVNPGSKFKSVEDIVKAMKSDPNAVTIATGGINSAGGAASEALKLAVGGNYKMVTYDGGNPAVQSTVAHETEITTQLVSEQYDMLRAKRLVPLAAYTPKAVTLSGIGTIPSITKFVPKAKVGPVHFGIWAPKGVPQDVVATMGKVWESKIKNSERLKKYAESKGLGVDVAWGEAAYKQAFETTQINAWQIFDGGKGKVSPDKVGFPRP
jgi:tripartite-type tricarboxylate transporter receptor subunit TctC